MPGFFSSLCVSGSGIPPSWLGGGGRILWRPPPLPAGRGRRGGRRRRAVRPVLRPLPGAALGFSFPPPLLCLLPSFLFIFFIFCQQQQKTQKKTKQKNIYCVVAKTKKKKRKRKKTDCVSCDNIFLYRHKRYGVQKAFHHLLFPQSRFLD